MPLVRPFQENNHPFRYGPVGVWEKKPKMEDRRLNGSIRLAMLNHSSSILKSSPILPPAHTPIHSPYIGKGPLFSWNGLSSSVSSIGGLVGCRKTKDTTSKGIYFLGMALSGHRYGGVGVWEKKRRWKIDLVSIRLAMLDHPCSILNPSASSLTKKMLNWQDNESPRPLPKRC